MTKEEQFLLKFVSGTIKDVFVNVETGYIFTGKAETEMGWPHLWESTKINGLIDYRLYEQEGKNNKLLNWKITEKGRAYLMEEQPFHFPMLEDWMMEPLL